MSSVSCAILHTLYRGPGKDTRVTHPRPARDGYHARTTTTPKPTTRKSRARARLYASQSHGAVTASRRVYQRDDSGGGAAAAATAAQQRQQRQRQRHELHAITYERHEASRAGLTDPAHEMPTNAERDRTTPSAAESRQPFRSFERGKFECDKIREKRNSPLFNTIITIFFK